VARGAQVVALTFAALSYSLGANAAEPIPFTRAGDLVVLEAKLNGSRPLAFVLDTGAAHMVVDSRIARELAMPENGESTIGGAGAGRIPFKKIERVSFALGALAAADYEFVSADLSGLTSIIGRQIHGIIGYAFFAHEIVTIDYARNQIELRDAASEVKSAGEALPIRIEKGWVFVRGTLRVAGLPEVTDEFLIDSGSNDAVDHPIAATARERAAVRSGNGLGAPVDGVLATAKSLRLGSHELRNLRVSAGGGNEQTNRLIGGAVLSRFKVTFDYPHQRVFLTPND